MAEGNVKSGLARLIRCEPDSVDREHVARWRMIDWVPSENDDISVYFRAPFIGIIHRGADDIYRDATHVSQNQCPITGEIARGLRKRMTPQEVKLWVYLRSWRKQGFHFRRQAPRDGYIVDFVCLKHRLVIEVDGGQHNFDAHMRRDAQRDHLLACEGFRVLRFWNNEIHRNLEGVLMRVQEALRGPHPASLREATLPREDAGEG